MSTSALPRTSLTLQEVARLMRVTEGTIRNWVRAGKFLRPLSFSARWRWDASVLERWLAEQQEGVSNAAAAS